MGGGEQTGMTLFQESKREEKKHQSKTSLEVDFQ